MEKKAKITSILSLITACLIYGFFPIIARTVGFNLPIFFQNWTRSLLEFLIIIPIIFSLKWVKVLKKDYLWLTLRTLGGAIGFLGSYYAFNYLEIGTSYFIFYFGMLVGGFILGTILFSEKITESKILALLLGLFGLYYIYSFNLKIQQLTYVLLALASGLGAAFWNTSSKKISDRYSAMQLNFIDIVLYGLLMFILSIFFKEVWTFPVWNWVWIGNLLFGAMFLLTGQLMVVGFKNIEGQLGSLIMMSEVVFGVSFGYLFYKEAISTKTLFGGLLILFALILLQVKLKKINSKQQ